MKTGKSLVELAQAVQDAASRNVDTVVDTRNTEIIVRDDKTVDLRIAGDLSTSTVTDHALGQMLEHTGVPAKYAERMRAEAPDLLETNVNQWLQRKPSPRLIRQVREGEGTLPSVTRAFLSNRYRRMDHNKQLAAVLPELMEQMQNTSLQVVSSELTERRLYLKAVFPRLTGEVKRGDIVQYGFELQNSEIGEGKLKLTPFLYRLVCLNGMILPSELANVKLAKAHLGRAQDEGVLDYASDEALEADDHALALLLRDTLRAFMDQDRWTSVLTTLRTAAISSETKDPIAAVAAIAKSYQLPQMESNEVLKNFLRDGDMTKWGMANAITAVANGDAVSYDRAAELETLGGRIITLTPGEWKDVSNAVTPLREAA